MTFLRYGKKFLEVEGAQGALTCSAYGGREHSEKLNSRCVFGHEAAQSEVVAARPCYQAYGFLSGYILLRFVVGLERAAQTNRRRSGNYGSKEDREDTMGRCTRNEESVKGPGEGTADNEKRIITVTTYAPALVRTSRMNF